MITDRTVEQIEQVYRRLVKEVKYAPAAPSDGMGHIIGPRNTAEEAKAYAEGWWEEEESCHYFAGCPNWSERPALIFTIEAARLICGMHYKGAAKLLRMAAKELENTES